MFIREFSNMHYTSKHFVIFSVSICGYVATLCQNIFLLKYTRITSDRILYHLTLGDHVVRSCSALHFSMGGNSIPNYLGVKDLTIACRKTLINLNICILQIILSYFINFQFCRPVATLFRSISNLTKF